MLKIIEFIKACIQGVIQGFTEILPISSSAHNALIAQLFHQEDFGLGNEIFLHLASTFAIIFFLRKDIIKLIVNLFKQETRIKSLSYILKLIIATVPALVIWIILGDKLDMMFTNIKLIGVCLLLTSLMLYLTSSNLHNQKTPKEISYKSSLGIGLFQALAIVPGISRSGSTLFGGTCFDNKQKDVIKFSLYLYLLASIGSLVLEFPSLQTLNFNFISILTFGICFITTIIAIKFLFNKFTIKHYQIFAIYTLLLGIISVIFG